MNEMREEVVGQSPLPFRSATFFCDACGEPAGSLELVATPGERAVLRVEGPAAQATFYLDGVDATASIQQAMSADSAADALYRLNIEYAPFYCPECQRNYCRACWQLTPSFDDDFPGWYDCTYG